MTRREAVLQAPASALEAGRREELTPSPRPPYGAGQREPLHAPSRASALALSIIAVFLLLRLVLMLAVGFGIDEDYTLANSRHFALSYFDHPPLHQWIAQSSLAVFGLTPWVRLPFVLLFSGTSWLLFALTRHLYGSRAALWALVALNVSAFFTVSAGGWVVPDGPLLFSLAAAAYGLAKLFFPAGGVSRPWITWITIGLCIGLAALSKYSAVLFVAGLSVFVLSSPVHRLWLCRPALWAGVVVALALCTPVLVWNAENGWLSFAFQGGRSLPAGRLNGYHVAAMIGGEAALLCPWLAVVLVIAMSKAARSARVGDKETFLLCLSLPPIVFFTIVPLWGARGLPHWSMPGWFFAFPMLGAWFVEGGWAWLRPRPFMTFAAGALAAVLCVGASEASTGWMRKLWPEAFAAGDPTIESLSWRPLREWHEFSDQPPDFIVTTRWTDAAKLGVAFADAQPVFDFSDDPRQFAFSHTLAAELHKNAAIVVPADRASRDLPKLAAYFASVGKPETVWLGRGSMQEVALVIVRASDLLRPFPLPYGTIKAQDTLAR